MIVCLLLASLVSIFSIFAFFGDAFSNTGGIVVPNMFHLMFGLTQNTYGVSIKWKGYVGLTILFVIQIIIMVIATFALYVASKIAKRDVKSATGAGVLGSLGLFSIIALTLSFLTIQLTGGDVDASSGVGLGVGPIVYSCLHIMVVIIAIIGIGLKNYQSAPVRWHPMHTTFKTPSESEKADLILKYKKMLDDGIITQEEFDKKKEDLLK